MPGRDRSGPMGMGPRTGRGAGFCTDRNAPDFANQAPAQGAFRGRGRRRGFGGGNGGSGRGRGFSVTGVQSEQRQGVQRADNGQTAATSEADELRQHAAALKTELDLINRRLNEIDKASDE